MPGKSATRANSGELRMLPVGCSREPFASLWFKPLTVQTYAVCMNQKTADSSTHQRPRAQTPAAPHIGIGANQCKFGKLGRTCRESVFSNDLEASTWAQNAQSLRAASVELRKGSLNAGAAHRRRQWTKLICHLASFMYT